MAKIYKTTFRIRRGTTEAFERNNPILQYGEPCFVKDNNGFKIGDGVTDWVNLPYIGADLTLAEKIQEAMELADSAKTIANNKIDSINPVGTGSFSMNRKDKTTIGRYSSALGYNTTASDSYSYAEGYNTIASGIYSHVQGECNISDTSPVDRITGRRKYAHIVGNGTSDSARSNAHTLDWNGVGWFQGGIQVGGTEQDGRGARSVLLEGDIISDEEIDALSALIQ